MLALRRFLVFQAFLLWQGGFLFYAAVVVPIGTELLGSPLLQGHITQQVTHWMNGFGTAWAIVFAWDVFATRDPKRRRKTSRWLGWTACVGLLAGLVLLHREMDAVLSHYEEPAYPVFRQFHIAYLWFSTFHWLIALVLAWQTLAAWRAEDDSGRTIS
jgi:hypothetical protein